jgi:EmrB/QacA subfamily drug resistance transporter
VQATKRRVHLRFVASLSGVPRSASSTPQDDYPRAILAVLLLAGVSFALAQTMIAPALPQVAEHLGTSTSSVTWLMTGFLLSASVSTPVVGKLGDLYGRGRTLPVVMLFFGAGSVICALAPNVEVAVAGRVLQGAAAGVFPLAFGIVRETFPASRVPFGIGLFSAVFGIGGGLALPMAGVITDELSVPWLFWTGILSVPVAVAAFRILPKGERRVGVQIDWLGAAILSVALAGVLLGVSQGGVWGWQDGRTLGAITGGLAAFALWIAVERRVAEPMVDLRVLASRPVAMTNLTGLLVGFAMFSSFLLIPQLAQAPESTGYGFGASVTGAGLVLVPSSILMLLAGPQSARLGARLGFRAVLAIGAAFAAASFVFLAVEHSELWHLAFASALLGVGIALSMASMANLIVAAVDPRDVGIATGINTIARTVGGAFGAAAATALLTADVLPSGQPGEAGYTEAFAMSALFGAVAVAAALAIPRRVEAAAQAPAAARPAPVAA